MKKVKQKDFGLHNDKLHPDFPMTDEEVAMATRRLIEREVIKMRSERYRAALSMYEYHTSNR